MYIPKLFENKNIGQLHQLIENFNFATLISYDNQETTVSHIPVMLDRTAGRYGTLFWHVANLNPHASKFDGNKKALFIFQGPHGYISPVWYKNFPAAPTWNYAVVHAYGVPHITGKEVLADNLTKMMDYHESKLNKNNNYIIPDEFKLKLLEHITGFTMEIMYIEEKFKLSQNRDLEDQKSILQALRKQNSADLELLADLMESVQNSEYEKSLL